MELPVSEQLFEAAAALAFGVAAGLLYDFLRVVRSRVNTKSVTALADFVFVSATGVALFLLGLGVGGGRQRLFMLALAILGAVLYFVSLSKPCRYLLEGVADVLMLLLFLITRPMVFAWAGAKKIGIFAKKLFISSTKWFIIRYESEVLPWARAFAASRRDKKARRKLERSAQKRATSNNAAGRIGHVVNGERSQNHEETGEQNYQAGAYTGGSVRYMVNRSAARQDSGCAGNKDSNHG
ncbi:MAG: spore cortex biosynthesis protein YabQ [Oscillospiraceae bacterium]|jgi:hypothetical protein|nr:spore cortex biosynthesis protein YabQ [Oscillospiraceae bacterium]